MGAGKRRIKIIAESAGEVIAKILEGRNPRTADAIWSALPLEGTAERWGDEVYFEVPVELEEENAQEVVEEGDVAYWPPGRSICIFFGQTPASKGDEIRAYSPVNVFAKIEGDPKIFRRVKDGEKIRMERV